MYCIYTVEYTVDLSHSEDYPAESNSAKRSHSFKPTQTYYLANGQTTKLPQTETLLLIS